MPGTAEREAGAVRSRRRAAPAGPPVLTVGLLASYTIDPLEPYLHVALADAGLVPQIVVGPFDQIVPECLDDGGRMGRFAPDVLVVAPRWEDMPDGAEEAELVRVADTATRAVDRRGACLVFVLPAQPRHGAGACDAGDPDGVVASVAAARQRLRSRLAGRPHVLVADAEQAVRDVGALHAYHPALEAFAGIPYTEEVFWRLGLGLARLLRLRFLGVPRAVLVGRDLLAPAHADVLRGPLLRLAGAGVRLAVAAPGTEEAFPPDLAGGWAPLAPHLARGTAGPGAGGLPALVDRLGPAVLLTADRTSADEAAATPGLEAVLLGPAPEAWPAELQESGVLDRPVPRRPDAGRGAAPPAVAEAADPSLTMAEYLSGLEVSVTFDAPAGVPEKATEVLARAKDFVLGPLPDGFVPDGFVPSGTAADDRLLLTARVRDRFGDYGLGAVAGLAFAGGTCAVDVLSVSCPVMGRGVEPVVLQEIVDIAGRRGCATVELRLTPTGRNDVALEFAERAQERAWEDGEGRPVAVRAVRR